MPESSRPGQQRIDGYSFGRITVAGRTYTKDIIIHENGVLPDWWRQSGHSLVPEDLEAILPLSPTLLIVGCGASGQLVVPPSTIDWLLARSIRTVPLPTREACDRYNEMASISGVVAALHLTC
jgi:hypothetical protein